MQYRLGIRREDPISKQKSPRINGRALGEGITREVQIVEQTRYSELLPSNHIIVETIVSIQK
jgi:hypothetical protein